jgi:hypothetical protein
MHMYLVALTPVQETYYMHIDNLAFVHIISKQTSRNQRVLSSLRHLILVSLLYNIQIKATHVGDKGTKL